MYLQQTATRYPQNSTSRFCNEIHFPGGYSINVAKESGDLADLAMDQSPLANVLGHLAKVSRWPRQERAHHPLPLLTGEAQLAAHSLPAASQRGYEAVARDIRDRLGLYPEEHRRRFRALVLAEGNRPFAFAQQLRDHARR